MALPLAAMLGLAACGEPARLGGPAVFFASGADLQSVNPLVTTHPLAKQVQKHVLLMTLASYDSLLEPTPRLADWEWDSDRRALSFALRRDVPWHDGVPTTAYDVAWTLQMARDARVAYPRRSDLAGIQSVTPLDSFTVRVAFAGAQSTFPDVMTDLAILPRHRFRDVRPGDVRTAAFERQPVGNGPFAFVEHRPNQRWVFRRSETFPLSLGRPSIERLVIAIVDEPTTKLAALTSGELDFAGISPAHAGFIRQDPRLDVIEYPVLFVNALIWNLRRPPFDDPAVRRALGLSIDRELIVRAYTLGFAEVAGGPVASEHPWHEPVFPERYDPEAAGSLLDAAGWTENEDGIRERGGRTLSFDLLTVGSGDNGLEQMLQAQLRDVGADARIRQLELATFLAVAQGVDRDFDALVTGIPGDLSLGYVAAMFNSGDPSPLAYSGYQSEEFNEAIEWSRRTVSEAELREAWGQAQRVLARDKPVAWLYHSRGVQGVNRRVRGVRLDLRGELAGIARWSVDSEEQRH